MAWPVAARECLPTSPSRSVPILGPHRPPPRCYPDSLRATSVDGGSPMSEQERIDPARTREDDTVVTTDGEHLGHVIAFWPDMLTPSHLVVEGGLLIHHDWY